MGLTIAKGLPRGGGGKFLVGSTCAHFDAPKSGSPWNRWYPSWYPPPAPTTPMAPSSTKELPYPIYFAKTNLDVHV